MLTSPEQSAAADTPACLPQNAAWSAHRRSPPAGRRGSSCRNGPQPVSSFLKFDSRAARAAAVFVVLAAHRERDAIARRHDDRGRPQLDVELDRRRRASSGCDFVVRVIRPVRQRELRIELAVRGAQPALRDRRVRIDRALEHDLLHVGGEHAQHQEQVGIGRRRRHEQLRRERAGDLGFALRAAAS